MTADQSRPVPRASEVQGIDRDALVKELAGFTYTGSAGDVYRLADFVLALVRPVEGVTLTPEEARRAVGWLDMSNVVPEDDDLALASRLEASS